jgi:hypothetical protein
MILAAGTCITRYAMPQTVIQNEGNFGEFKLRAHEAYSPTLFYSNGCLLYAFSQTQPFSRIQALRKSDMVLRRL